MSRDKINIFWFRRDLRLQDNHGLYQALSNELPVLPVFIFDKNILAELTNKEDARVNFIFNSLEKMNEKLKPSGAGIQYLFGKPIDIFTTLFKSHSINCIFCNEDTSLMQKKETVRSMNWL